MPDEPNYEELENARKDASWGTEEPKVMVFGGRGLRKLGVDVPEELLDRAFILTEHGYKLLPTSIKPRYTAGETEEL